MKKLVFALAPVAGALSSGCGGGGMGGPTSAGSQHVSMGQVSADYFGQAKPAVIQNSGAVAVTGLAGATFSTVSMTPTKTLANTTIAFTTAEKSLWTYSNGNLTEIGGYGYSATGPAFSPNGLIAFSAYQGGALQVFTCNYDGSNLHQLTSGSTAHANPSWAPNGQKIAYDDLSNIWVMNSSGTSPVKMAAGIEPAFTPDGAKISFLAPDPGSKQNAVWMMPAAGGAATELLGQGQSTAIQTQHWGPLGTLAVCLNYATPEVATLFVNSAYSFQNEDSVPAAANTQGYIEPTIAPDGIHLACVREDNPGPSDWRLCLTDATGLQQQEITPDSSTWIDAPCWSPYPAAKNFVGSGGVLYPSAAGFLYALNGDGFGSFLAFAATTPSTATITPQTSGDTGASIFLLQADTIQTLKYQNVYYGQVISQTINAPEVLVSVSAQTGQISTVLPAIVSRTASAAPKAKKQGGSLVYTGRFPAVYDGKGKNLAPNGATEVELDAKTGKLISSR